MCLCSDVCCPYAELRNPSSSYHVQQLLHHCIWCFCACWASARRRPQPACFCTDVSFLCANHKDISLSCHPQILQTDYHTSVVQTPNFHKLSAVSLAAAIMSISYSTIAIGVSAHAGRQPDAEYNLDGFTRAEGIFGIFNALGTIAFAYGGHNVVLEIQVRVTLL